MKKIVSVFSTLIIFLAIYKPADAQLRKVPSEVTNALQDKYPDAKNVEWKDHLTSFVAAFSMDDVRYEAKFDNDGEWKETEIAITNTDIPEAVMDGYKKSKYAGEWPIQRAVKIELPDEVIRYRLEVKKNDLLKKYLTFNTEGRLLKDNITL